MLDKRFRFSRPWQIHFQNPAGNYHSLKGPPGEFYKKKNKTKQQNNKKRGEFRQTLCYDPETCELFVGGMSPNVWRIDLNAGVFMKPLECTDLSSIHMMALNPVMPVLACAGNDGTSTKCFGRPNFVFLK